MKKRGPVHAHNDLLLAMIGAQRAFILKRICAIWCMHLTFVHVNWFSGNVSTMRCIGNEGANCGLISTIQKLSILRWCWTSKWRGGQKNDIAHGVLDSREFSSQRVLCAKTPHLQISTFQQGRYHTRASAAIVYFQEFANASRRFSLLEYDLIAFATRSTIHGLLLNETTSMRKSEISIVRRHPLSAQ